MASKTLGELIAMLQLQQKNLPTYQTAVGATTQDLTDVDDELELLVYMSDFSDIVDEDKKTVTSIKNAIFNGEEDQPVPGLPVFPVGTYPNTPKSGILSIASRRNNRYKNAQGYTNEIGIALGIVGPKADPLSPELIKPTIEAFPAATGYHFALVVSKREGADMWDAYILRKGGISWTKAASATGKSTDVTIQPTTAGEPEQVQVRVQLRKSNTDYGQPSDPTFVTVNP